MTASRANSVQGTPCLEYGGASWLGTSLGVCNTQRSVAEEDDRTVLVEPQVTSGDARLNHVEPRCLAFELGVESCD